MILSSNPAKMLSLNRSAAWGGRAGAMRAIASSMPPHAYPRQGRRRHALWLLCRREGINFALVAVYDIIVLFAAGRATGGRQRNSGSNMCQRWRAHRVATANNTNSPKVYRLEG